MQHRNAPLTPNGRRRLVALVEEEGFTFEAAAAASNVAKSTAHDLGHALAGASRRAAPHPGLPRGSLLASAPQPADAQRGRPRAHLRGAPAHRLGAAPDRLRGRASPTRPSTGRCAGAAARAGRGSRGEAVARYEWPCPGDLLHIDTKRYARFRGPGHAVTGDRTARREKRERAGYEFVHSIVDDHSRLAYSELHARRARAHRHRLHSTRTRFFAAHGIVAERLLTDNAWVYTKNSASPSCSPSAAISTCSSSPAARRPTARWSASSRRSNASGLSARATAHRAPRRGPATLARPLQRAPTPLSHRQPPADQSRSGRLGAGQLGRPR